MPEGMTKLLAEHGETLCHCDSDAADAISSILGRYSDGREARLSEAGLLPRFVVYDPHCTPSKISDDPDAKARTLPSDASQPYEAAIFACFERHRLELNGKPLVNDMEQDARRLLMHYFNTLVDVPNREPFEARIAKQAIKFALIYHVFSQIAIEQRGPEVMASSSSRLNSHRSAASRWRPDSASPSGS